MLWCDHADHTTTATIQPKDTFTASGDLGGVDVTLFDEDSEVLKRDEFYYKFRQVCRHGIASAMVY